MDYYGEPRVMATTLTLHYNWLKPNEFEEIDIWGGELNQNFDAIDAQVFANQTAAASALSAANSASSIASAALARSGGTMTGPIVLNADGAAPLNPASFGQMNTALALKGNLSGNNIWTTTNEIWVTTAAGGGPYIDHIWRPAAPANSGVASVRRELARNTTNNADVVFSQEVTITQDVTPGSESAVVQFMTIRGGAVDTRMSLGRGLFMKNNTTDPGDGNVAATSFVENGTALASKYAALRYQPNVWEGAASYTFIPADAGKVIINGSNAAATFLVDGAQAWAGSERFEIFNWGTGTTTIGVAGGAAVQSKGNKLSIPAMGAATLYCINATNWFLAGDLT